MQHERCVKDVEQIGKTDVTSAYVCVSKSQIDLTSPDCALAVVANKKILQ